MVFKKLTLLYFAVLLSLLWSCKSKQLTTEEKSQNLAILDSLYDRNNYYLEINVAYPFMTGATARTTNFLMRNTGNTANRIDVSGDGNFIKIQNDSIIGYLPFFGERRLNAGTYGSSDVSIQFEEIVENVTKKINTDKGKIEIDFTAHQKGNSTEKYEITIHVFPNKKVSVDVRPRFKTIMRYDGFLTEVEKKK